MRKLSSLSLPWPTNWDVVFGDHPTEAPPLIVEIGFGRGAFLWHLATQHPDARIVGLEISNRCLLAAEQRLERGKFANVCVIHSRAETALHHLLTPASVTEFHINFPDPWFKRGHSHRRLMQRDTLDALVSRLVPGGRLYLATDIRDYAEMSAELLQATPGLTNLLSTPWTDAMPGRVVTKYEAKARAEGRPCHYFAYERNHLPAPDVPLIEELPMPHVVLTLPLTLDEIAAQFEPRAYREGVAIETNGETPLFTDGEAAGNPPSDATVIHFMAVFRGRGSLLFETHIGEPTIDQRIGLLLMERWRGKAGEYTIQPATLGHPRMTEGMHTAVKLLAEWVLALSPEGRVLGSKLRGEE
jgi:tRNA (guanine-N7-)-methyltransferase